MDKTQIKNFIMQNGGTEIAVLQSKYAITYKEAKSVVDELIDEKLLVYESGLKYTCAKKDCGDDFKREVDERRAYIEARRQELLRRLQEDDDFIADDDDEDDDDFIADDEPDCEDAGFKAQAQILKSTLHSIMDKKSENTSADNVPAHWLWPDEEVFVQTVLNRMELLIKSDKKMGQRGAVKKAEAYLEAVRDTNDEKMVQVYERLVYEVKNTSSYMYCQLKKQFFAEWFNFVQ